MTKKLTESNLERMLNRDRLLVQTKDYSSVRSILSSKSDKTLDSKHGEEVKLRKRFDQLCTGGFLDEVGYSALERQERKLRRRQKKAKKNRLSKSSNKSSSSSRRRLEEQQDEEQTCMQLFFLDNLDSQGLKPSTKIWLENRGHKKFAALELPVGYFDPSDEMKEAKEDADPLDMSTRSTPDPLDSSTRSTLSSYSLEGNGLGDIEREFVTSLVAVVDTRSKQKKKLSMCPPSTQLSRKFSVRSRVDKGGVLDLPTGIRNPRQSKIAHAMTA